MKQIVFHVLNAIVSSTKISLNSVIHTVNIHLGSPRFTLYWTQIYYTK